LEELRVDIDEFWVDNPKQILNIELNNKLLNLKSFVHIFSNFNHSRWLTLITNILEVEGIKNLLSINMVYPKKSLI